MLRLLGSYVNNSGWFVAEDQGDYIVVYSGKGILQGVKNIVNYAKNNCKDKFTIPKQWVSGSKIEHLFETVFFLQNYRARVSVKAELPVNNLALNLEMFHYYDAVLILTAIDEKRRNSRKSPMR